MEAGTNGVGVRGRRRDRSRTLLLQRIAALAIVGTVGGALVGFLFAGSPAQIAAGVRVAGVNVGGLTASQATTKLERRAGAVSQVPVVFTAAGHTWRLRAGELGVQADWHAAVKLALQQGDGLGPFRGLRRIGVRVFGADVSPPTRVTERSLEYELGRMSRAIETPHRDAAIALRGLQARVVPGRTGRVLARDAASTTLVQTLAGFRRGGHVDLPVRVDTPSVAAGDLQPALQQVRTALSKRVRMNLGAASWWLPKRQLAAILALPHDGARKLSIGGPGATRYFRRLGRGVNRPAQNASFNVHESGRVTVVPAKLGRVISVRPTERSILAAALSPGSRNARVIVAGQPPDRTTAEARAMGITTRVGRYETIYGGDSNRIHNVQLVARLVDRKLIAPGSTFSFNQTTGARTADKGFLEAPVIINGELSTGLGGGVCQVSTTVFNAAYEAGLKITSRTNHALYISHYPQGRDATVNYPDVDLQFVNDTGHWLLLRTFVGSSSLVVDLYGAPLHRRVESETQPLVTTGGAPVKRIPDPNLYVGVNVVDESGSPSSSTSVRRKVYSSSGALMYDNTWYSSYRGETRLVRVGTKPRPKKIGPTGPTGPSGPSGPTGATGITSPR
ncbi:MAG TPA: VanW family protein [Gaiellaceae bacterium]|nr:VanW family protein [Gaiellaceae bacterium]